MLFHAYDVLKFHLFIKVLISNHITFFNWFLNFYDPQHTDVENSGLNQTFRMGMVGKSELFDRFFDSQTKDFRR